MTLLLQSILCVHPERDWPL